MSIRLSALLLVALSLMAPAQSTLPPDIHPVTLSRLPPVTPEDLDEEGRRLLAARTSFTPGPGPTHITIYSPRERDLGIPSGEKSPVGARYFQLAVLITAREIDQQYEWSSHEPAGLRQGLEQSVIDVVKYDRDVAGLSDKDATMISFGRALFRQHRVSSELWQKMVSHFGRQHTIQIMAIMGDYFRVGFMLNAVDQQLPPTRKALLPPLKRSLQGIFPSSRLCPTEWEWSTKGARRTQKAHIRRREGRLAAGISIFQLRKSRAMPSRPGKAVHQWE